MEYSEWEEWYEKICQDMGYSEDDDKRSAQLLADLLSGTEQTGLSMIEKIIRDQNVLIIGPSINDAGKIESANFDVMICADDAILKCQNAGLMPDIIVTDLDGDIPAILRANRLGALAVIHAHGDNMAAMKEWVPKFTGNIIGTAQCRPPKGLHNFGGFTDGDRAVVMAEHFGAASITLAGFDLEKPVPKPGKDPEVKRKKLAWAKKIIDTIPDIIIL